MTTITPAEAKNELQNGKICRLIDQTLLSPDASREQIIKFVQSAVSGNFFSVCLHPSWLKIAGDYTENSKTALCTVVGFPSGATTTKSKQFETDTALSDGASEIDMVINIGMLKSGNIDYVAGEITALKKLCGIHCLKVIIETCLLTNEEKVTAAKIIVNSGADFVKTSTGFSSGGANLSDIKLLRGTVPDSTGIKASGGIHNLTSIKAMIEAGATRIGTSRGLDILEQISK